MTNFFSFFFFEVLLKPLQITSSNFFPSTNSINLQFFFPHLKEEKKVKFILQKKKIY